MNLKEAKFCFLAEQKKIIEVEMCSAGCMLVATNNECEEFFIGCWASELTDQQSLPKSSSWKE